MNVLEEWKESVVLHKGNLTHWQKNGIHFFLEGDLPHWIACDQRGSQLLDWIDGQKNIGELVRLYSKKFKFPLPKSWMHIQTFLKDVLRKGFLSTEPKVASPYLGRNQELQLNSLKELWVHLTQTCNLSCSHCLVSSSPKGEMGKETQLVQRVIEESLSLGVERFYFTGGEPFVRPDIFDLIRLVTERNKKELILLTNATLLDYKVEQLKTLDREKIKFQISLDGTTAPTNDSIRGVGVFEKVRKGLNLLDELGFECSLTAVATRENIRELKNLPLLAKKWGAQSVHLMWPHKRGRILDCSDPFPKNRELLKLVRAIQKKSRALGILFDNAESFKMRINGQPHTKYDLSSICWESLCFYMDGNFYPSAATAGDISLSLGSLNGKRLEAIWRESELAQKIRSASLAQIENIQHNPFRFLIGGGDMELAYFFALNGNESHWNGQDPYYELYVELAKDIMLELSQENLKTFNTRSGYDAPILFHSMGEESVACSEDAQSFLTVNGQSNVKLLHSNCVLSFNVEKPYQAIQKFYGAAAEEPKEKLCCPVKYDPSEVGHIPQEVLDRFYGCGSPISMGQVKEGETVLDLGSGAGIDCFIAAKKVGNKGRVIGIDMTDPMLLVAKESQKKVAINLGYDVVEFKKGYLEKIPIENQTVDLVTSNCVINLSPNKRKVFSEIWRILKDHGRFVVADIISDKTVPLSLQAHQDLWGECISGSLSEEEFLSALEKAGFYGISLLKKSFWKEVQGVHFYSVTVQGFKFEKKKGCLFLGQKAIYLGPYKSIMDEEGHLFPRGEAIEVCTDTAAKLKNPPYCEQFTIQEPALNTPKEVCGPSCCC